MSVEVETELKNLMDVIRQADDKKHFTGQNGKEYVVDGDGDVSLLDDPLIDRPLQLNQLSSLVDWLDYEGDAIDDKLMIHVISPTDIDVVGQLNQQGIRPIYAQVEAVVDRLPFGRFLDQEKMIILLQSEFEHNPMIDGKDDRDIILQVVSNLRSEEVHQQTDDGVSQSVQINSGVASVNEVKVPNPVELIPFRTFQEIVQPSSKFIFRMRDGMESALFEADNSQWKIEAKKDIKEYFNRIQEDRFGKVKYPVIA